MIDGTSHEVSNEGRIRYKGKIKNVYNTQTGVIVVSIKRDGKWITPYLHRLVADNFCDRPSIDHDTIAFKDGNKLNCSADNLEHLTKVEHFNRNWRNKLPDNLKPRVVDCYDLSGNYLKTYPSIKKAAETLGLAQSNICYHMSKKTTRVDKYIFK